MNTRFDGEWKYLNESLLSTATERAEKACLELAMLLRILDDREHISEYLKAAKREGFGRLVMKDKPDQELSIRDVVNKIIHARGFEWDFSDADNPILVCESSEREKWIRAEVQIVALAALCGMLMS